MSVNTKVHHYFSETPPARWDIQKFLEQEFSAQGKAYNHNRALSNWISSLRHLSKGDNLSNASPANVKIESYYLNGTRGHPSDKTIAQKWYDRINRRGKKRKQDAGNLPLPRAQRIKNTFRVTRVNGSVNLHGAGANNATDGTSAVLDDSAEAAAPAAAPDPPPASFACSDSDREEPIETSHLVETLQSLGHLYNKMTNKLALSDGRFLEDLLQTHALSLDELSPAHFFIVDKELLEVVLKDTPDEVARVMDATIKFPPFPEHLRTSMLRYQAAKTTDQCRNIARGSSDDEDVYWIDDVFRHVVKLITKSGDILLYDGLNEGVWDSLVYPPLWDEYLVTIPTIVLQRKEIPLVSCVPYPYRPGRPLHYDGVVQSRTPRSRRTEFAVFEVSRSGTDTRKIAVDRDKLIGGCRAMLCSLMEVVEYDAEALSRLVVVGVLHAGRSTQLLTMSCLSRNVLIMSEGLPWELPVDVKKLTALYDVIHDVWKVKWAIQTTEAAVNDFFERKESRELEEHGKKWGEENVC